MTSDIAKELIAFKERKEAQIKELSEKLDHAQYALDEYDMQNARCHGKIESLEAQITKLTEELDHAQYALDESQKQNETYYRIIEKDEILQVHGQRWAAWKKTCESLRMDINDTRKQMNLLRHEHYKLKMENDNMIGHKLQYNRVLLELSQRTHAKELEHLCATTKTQLDDINHRIDILMCNQEHRAKYNPVLRDIEMELWKLRMYHAKIETLQNQLACCQEQLANKKYMLSMCKYNDKYSPLSADTMDNMVDVIRRKDLIISNIREELRNQMNHIVILKTKQYQCQYRMVIDEIKQRQRNKVTTVAYKKYLDDIGDMARRKDVTIGHLREMLARPIMGSNELQLQRRVNVLSKETNDIKELDKTHISYIKELEQDKETLEHGNMDLQYKKKQYKMESKLLGHALDEKARKFEHLCKQNEELVHLNETQAERIREYQQKDKSVQEEIQQYERVAQKFKNRAEQLETELADERLSSENAISRKDRVIGKMRVDAAIRIDQLQKRISQLEHSFNDKDIEADGWVELLKKPFYSQ